MAFPYSVASLILHKLSTGNPIRYHCACGLLVVMLNILAMSGTFENIHNHCIKCNNNEGTNLKVQNPRHLCHIHGNMHTRTNA